VNLVGDKQFVEPEAVAPEELAGISAGEDIDLEAVLGSGIRKGPGVVAALDEEPETAETAL